MGFQKYQMVISHLPKCDLVGAGNGIVQIVNTRPDSRKEDKNKMHNKDEKIRKSKKLNELCHNLLSECTKEGFTVSEVKEVPNRLNEIIENSIGLDERNFDEAVNKISQNKKIKGIAIDIMN